MTARRLLVALVIVLGLSSLAAALVVPPPPAGETGGDSASTEGADRRDERGGGRLVRARIDVGAGKPPKIRVEPGDQLALRVFSRRPVQVRVPAFGVLEDVDRLDPARFDLLIPRRGRFSVQLARLQRTIATIVAGPAARAG